MTEGEAPPNPRLDQAKDTSVRLILENSARELSAAADRCIALQWSLSRLLETAHHPDLSMEMHLLQDIDRIQQELKDISTLLTSIAPTTSDLKAKAEAVTGSIKLDSLRARIAPSTPEETQRDEFPNTKTSEVTWF